MVRQAMEVDETFRGECASEKRKPVPTGEQPILREQAEQGRRSQKKSREGGVLGRMLGSAGVHVH